MRKVLFVLAILSLAFGVAGAKDYNKDGCGELVVKSLDGNRQGGDTMETATVIDAIPATLTGTTVDFADDYDVACSWAGAAPDVVYSFTTETAWTIDVSTCGLAAYDTKIFVADSEGNVVGCNDDYTGCAGYTSAIYGLELAAGMTYFFFVDGYGTDSGEYVMEITGEQGTVPPEPGETCELALLAAEGWNSAPFATSYFTYTTSEEPGDLLITSCADFQTADTHLFVYDACDGNLLAESDDDNGGCGEAGTFNYASTVSFPATALTTYVIEWTDHWSAAPFEFFIGEVVNGVSNDDTSFGAVKAMFR
jgi:hypothetical protein